MSGAPVAPGGSPAPERREAAGPAGPVSFLVWAPEGEATPVALAHPVNTQAAAWSDLAPLLTEGGRRPVYAVDYRGHGRSVQTGPFTARDYAADLLAVLRASGVERAHVAGGSIGGAVGVQLVDLAPGLAASLTLVAAALRIGVGEEAFAEMERGVRELGVEDWFAAHGGGILGRRSAPGVAERLVELAGGRDAEQVCTIIEWTFVREDSRDLARALAAAGALPPALVVGGEQDPTCPPASQEEAAAILGADLVILEGIGHLPMLECPAELAGLVLPFLDRAESPGRA